MAGLRFLPRGRSMAGRVWATDMPGSRVTGHPRRCAFSHASTASASVAQAISTWSRRLAAHWEAGENLVEHRSRPPTRKG
jgi:hypothetical protein